MREIYGLPKDGAIRFVSSYGYLKWNYNAPDSPLLVIGLTKLADRNQVASATIALLDGMFLPIGTMIQFGRTMSLEPLLPSLTLTTTIDFKAPRYTKPFPSFNSKAEGEIGFTIPPDEWKVPRAFADSKFLDVTDRSGTRLLIPTLEIFLKTYGTSAYFRKTFLNYFTEDALQELTYKIDFEKQDNSPLPGEVPLGLRRNVHDLDAPIIYSLQSSVFLKKIHRSVRNQLIKDRSTKCFLAIPFWFQEKVDLSLRGKYVSNASGERCFLVHEIAEMSYPKLPDFFIDRENTNEVTDKKRDRPPKNKGWTPNATEDEDKDKKKKKRPMDSKSPVGNNPASMSGRSAGLGIIGKKPGVRKAVRKEKQTSSGASRKSKQDKKYSSSNMRGKGGVGSAKIATNLNLVSTSNSDDDSLFEAWDGLFSLLTLDEVTNVEALAINGMQPVFTPTVSFVQFPRVNSWAISRSKDKSKRLLLVVKITTTDNVHYVFEIEQKFSRAGKPYSRHSGAIIDSGLSAKELLAIIDKLPDLEGKWRDMPDKILDKMKIFKHMKLRELGMHKVIVNVLIEHLGIVAPDETSKAETIKD